MEPVRVVPTEFTSEGATIRGGLFIPAGAGPFPGICEFHGLPDGGKEAAPRLASAGFLVLTFDFRGFRRSDGIFRLSREIEDAEHAVTHLLRSELSRKGWVGVYGASYGGAVAICSAARVRPRKGRTSRRAPSNVSSQSAAREPPPASMSVRRS